MTNNSDVMTTIYNHQSVICLLEYVEKIQREATELTSIFSSPRSPPPSYESDVTEDSCTSATTTDYSSPGPRSQHQHFRTNIKSMPYLALKKYYGIPLIATNLRSKSLLGKGQIYLPKEGFKRAFSWAEGVVSERVLEQENQHKRIEQLLLNLLFHPQLKHYIRQNVSANSKNSSETTSAPIAVTTARTKPLESKKPSSNKPLQKVAPQYVKKVVAEVIEQIDDEEDKNVGQKPRPHSSGVRAPHSKPVKNKSTQVNFDLSSAVRLEDIGTQYEEFPAEQDCREKVEITRVLLSGNYLNSNITNFVSSRLEKLGVEEEVWDLFQLVLDDVNSNIYDAKK